MRPHMVLGTLCVRPGENERETIVVCGTLGEPVTGFWTVGRIAPDESLPRSQQTVVFDGEIICGSFPWTLDWRARVEVERAECLDDFRRRQPFFLAIFKIPVVPEVAEFGGFVTADDVGVTRDFPND